MKTESAVILVGQDAVYTTSTMTGDYSNTKIIGTMMLVEESLIVFAKRIR